LQRLVDAAGFVINIFQILARELSKVLAEFVLPSDHLLAVDQHIMAKVP
jgi:hypothetical protein